MAAQLTRERLITSSWYWYSKCLTVLGAYCVFIIIIILCFCFFFWAGGTMLCIGIYGSLKGFVRCKWLLTALLVVDVDSSHVELVRMFCLVWRFQSWYDRHYVCCMVTFSEQRNGYCLLIISRSLAPRGTFLLWSISVEHEMLIWSMKILCGQIFLHYYYHHRRHCYCYLENLSSLNLQPIVELLVSRLSNAWQVYNSWSQVWKNESWLYLHSLRSFSSLLVIRFITNKPGVWDFNTAINKLCAHDFTPSCFNIFSCQYNDTCMNL